MKHRFLWASCFSAALALFTGYVMLDTFLIPTVGISDASEINNALFEDEEIVPITTSDTTGEMVQITTTEKSKPYSHASPGTSGKENTGHGTRPASTNDEIPQTVESSGSDTTTIPDSTTTPEVSAAGTEATAESTESTSHQKPQSSGGGQHGTHGNGNGHGGTGHGNQSGKTTEPESTATSVAAASPTVTTADTDYDGNSIGFYSDDNISIDLKSYYENDTMIYAADITVSSARYLKTAFANDSYGKNVTAKTSDTAKSKNAILAVNGDYYGAKESGYVIRNGVLYRDYGSADTDVLCIYSDGHFEITNSSEKTAQQLIDEGVWQAFCFGPALIENSEVSVGANTEVGKAMASNPRTAIGIIDDKHYVFVVSDGRTSESEGLSLKELADFMKKLGVTTAYNLDGGGSSTMYFDGKVINNPTTSGNSIKERSVSDIVYIGY